MSELKNHPSIPKSLRHKRILDVAAENPEASLEAIAAEIPSATAELVERILEEHGDPAADESILAHNPEVNGMEHDHSYPDPDELSTKQLETLQTIAEYPEATQREIADHLDVSSATVSTRMNGIEGFDWEERRTFAEAVIQTDTDMPDNPTKMKSNDTGATGRIDDLTEQVRALEQRVDDITGTEDSHAVFTDPELVHKVVHACLESDAITEDEEMRILQTILE